MIARREFVKGVIAGLLIAVGWPIRRNEPKATGIGWRLGIEGQSELGVTTILAAETYKAWLPMIGGRGANTRVRPNG